jgi:hypothetical protein
MTLKLQEMSLRKTAENMKADRVVDPRHGADNCGDGTFAKIGGLSASRLHLESTMAARRITLRVQPPMPFGDVTMVPATLSGRPEADMARAMTAAFADIEAPTAADVFNRLRQSFPLVPLNTRVAVLGVLMDRLRRSL